jgi:DNA-binding Lrp family transcriptional regulator
MSHNVSPSALAPLDQHLLNEMQDRFPLVREPFAELAARTETSERAVIERLRAMRESGVLRQVSPIFDTKALGYASSLVAMRVPEERLAHAAKIVNAHPGVSHNYRRTHAFNMWFTIAVPPGSDLNAHVDTLHRLTGAQSTRTLPTLRLFKIGVTLDMTGERAIDHRSEPQYTHERRDEAARHQVTARDIAVIRAVQGDLALDPDPFAAPARDLGIDVGTLLHQLEDLQHRGFLRRFAAILRHRKAGFGANGMAVWDVGERDILHTGAAMAGYTTISHCYQRPKYEDWRYNLFTMIHARRKSEVEEFVAQLAARHNLPEHAVLYSTTEFKKVRLAYFTPESGAWEDEHLSAGADTLADLCGVPDLETIIDREATNV